MEDSDNITPIALRQRQSARAASRRLERMKALLDQLEGECDEQRPVHDSHKNDWAPRDHNGVAMRLGKCDGDIHVPIVQSEADWDRATIEREDVFHRRFGFAWPLRYREALIVLKHEHELTDHEIRRLHGTGNLRRCETGVRFVASLLMAITGYAMIALLALPLALIVLRTSMSLPLLTSKQSLEVAMLAMVLLVIQGGTYRIYVEPWRIHRRSI